MAKTVYSLFCVAFFSLLLAGCGDSKETKTEGKADQSETSGKMDKVQADNTDTEVKAPDFTNPELKKYFGIYTAYLNKVVASIQNMDEVGTMKIFTEEGKQFNDKNEMEQKAQSEEKEVFNAWLLETMPAQKIIVTSDYYKKFNEAYYKKVREDFEKKNN